jgi:hypothetical protein
MAAQATVYEILSFNLQSFLFMMKLQNYLETKYQSP